MINYSQTRAYVARGRGGASTGKTRKERTTIAAKLGKYLQNWMRECGKGNEELRPETSWGGMITRTHFPKTPFGVRPGLGPAYVFSLREWCYYLILSYLTPTLAPLHAAPNGVPKHGPASSGPLHKGCVRPRAARLHVPARTCMAPWSPQPSFTSHTIITYVELR